MKVILTEEIRGLGTRGDVVTVKDGYARNYLLPKNLAREATAGNLKQVEHERRKWALLAQEEKNVAQKAADRVKGVKVRIEKRVGEHGQLFGSVTANEIADALAEKGIEVDKRRIELEQPIKTVGLHDVDVRLHRDVTARIQVEVAAQGVETIEDTGAAAGDDATAEQ
ncbi:MAG TPA: 50S ribosomal protein L9 [Thermoanaerobaculia bacterium]|nr:50S ribosomal protein L9 [Thermoanaerobaculia bacterium]